MTGLFSRRDVLQTALGTGLGTLLSACSTAPAPDGIHRIVVIGGGFGGTIAAKQLRKLNPKLDITLIDRNPSHICCPFSNYVLTGQRPLSSLTFSYTALCERYKIRFVQGNVTAIDPDSHTITVTGTAQNGTTNIRYDDLILSPGIDFRDDDIDGYDARRTPLTMPHAWIAGEQTILLKNQIDAMPDGGVVLISVPPAPYRCPSGPYERASLLAEHFSRHKPRSKIIILDANPTIQSLDAHFRKLWSERFPSMIEYVADDPVIRLDDRNGTLVCRSGASFRGDVVNVIPAQKAGGLARETGLLDAKQHWCPVVPDSFESTKVQNIYVIGDAAQANPMPKSGYSANSHAKACAINLVNRIAGRPPIGFSGINVCYIGLSANETASFAAVYATSGQHFITVPGTGGVSPIQSPFAQRERDDAESWLRNILVEMSE